MITPVLKISDYDPEIIVFVTSTSSYNLIQILSDDFHFEQCMRKLSLSEQRAVRNSRHNPIKQLVLRLFSKYVLNFTLSLIDPSSIFLPWKELQYSFNEFGKPELLDHTGQSFQFNSSSSNDLASIAVQFHQSTPVGIDLSHEVQDSISSTDFMQQFEGIFSKEELSNLESIKDLGLKYHAFNQLWTLKEAFTKFLGTGLNIDLFAFSFNLNKSGLLTVPQTSKELFESLREVNLCWQNDIEVDTDRLPIKLQEQIGTTEILCSSAILKSNLPSNDVSTNTMPKLPVILSVVHQLAKPNYRCMNINLISIIKDIINNPE